MLTVSVRDLSSRLVWAAMSAVMLFGYTAMLSFGITLDLRGARGCGWSVMAASSERRKEKS